MKSVNQEDSGVGQNNQEREGTTIITVAPKEVESFSSSVKKKAKRRVQNRKERLPKIMNEYNEQPSSEVQEEDAKDKQNERNSQNKLRAVDQETAGEVEEGGLATPYEFLTQRSPSLFTIFFPRFTVCSITFWASILYIIMFVALLGYNYSKEQTDITWNCSLYQLQNKYFPRLNYNHEVWRVFVSAIFHSNIAHFFLNLFAFQIYGYFVEWYYGKKAYLSTLLVAMIFSHFFSAVVQKTSVSTTSSAATMAVIALKIYFLWEYRHFRKLADRRSFLYILIVLILGINLIPIFVVNNVDFSAHLGGFMVGCLLGMFFHTKKIEEPTKCDIVLKWASVLILVIGCVLVIALTFSISNSDYQFLATNIQTMCLNNHI